MTDFSERQAMLLRISAAGARGEVGGRVNLRGADWHAAYALFRRDLVTIERPGSAPGLRIGGMRATRAGLAVARQLEPITSSRGRKPA